jgi:hydrogenase assembly chaperone HypC/HupF
MCLGAPARVLEVVDGGEVAVVESDGCRQRVPLTALTVAGERVVAGDWLLLLTGLAVERLNEADALSLLDIQAQARGEEDRP